MEKTPPPLDPVPPSREVTSEPAEQSEFFPLWAAVVLAFVVGGAGLLVHASEVGEAGGGIGYRIGTLVGRALAAPILALLIALLVKPLRSLRGFCLTYAAVAGLALIGMLRR